MRCPMCRQGLGVYLDADSLPLVWRSSAHAHVERIQKELKAEEIASDHQLALHAAQATTTVLDIFMCVYFTDGHGAVNSRIVTFGPNHQPMPETLTQPVDMQVSRACTRALSALMLQHHSQTMRMVVFARCHNTELELVEIADSGDLEVPVYTPDDTASIAGVRRQQPVISRNITIVQTAIPHAARPTANPGGVSRMGTSHFDVRWQLFDTNSLDTLTEVSFSIPFIDLVATVGGIFTSATV